MGFACNRVASPYTGAGAGRQREREREREREGESEREYARERARERERSQGESKRERARARICVLLCVLRESARAYMCAVVLGAAVELEHNRCAQPRQPLRFIECLVKERAFELLRTLNSSDAASLAQQSGDIWQCQVFSLFRPARCTRGSGDRFGIPKPRESGSVIGADRTVWALLCVAERRATRPSGEWGYRTRRHMLEPSAQRRCHPTEALYVPTFSHLLIVNKLLSLSLSLSLSRVWVDQHVNIYITMNPYFQPAGAETTETDVVALSSRANPLQRHQKREEPS
jgi:hypothetical protein